MDTALAVSTGSIEIEIGINLLLVDHTRFDVLWNFYKSWISIGSLRKFDRTVLNDVISRIILLIDPVSESHYQLFSFPLSLQKLIWLLHWFKWAKVFHRCFIGSTMQWSSKSSNCSCDSAIEIRHCRNRTPRSKCWSIEIMLCVED